MDQSLIHRLAFEYQDITNNPIEGISLAPVDENNLLRWQCYIYGPSESPYENGAFELYLEVVPEYPFKPPKVKFVTPIYHPNVNESGDICISTLKDDWNPTLTISKTILSISSLLLDPNPGDPLRPELARQYVENKAEFDTFAREWTARYAFSS